jgi:predicted phage baseplate assembly protein
VSFGDGLQGYIPPAGSEITAALWRHGGGAAGNDVLAGAVKTMVTQVAGIEKVINPRAAAGGAEEETIDHFIQTAPNRLTTSSRAVITTADFESRARSIGGVAKAKALGGRHPDFPDVPVPGAVTVYVVADSDALPPAPSAELIRSICSALDPVRLITTEVYVAAPTFVEIRIEARILAAPESSFDQVRIAAGQRLNDYLSPYARDFGEKLASAAIYAQLFGSNADKAIRSIEDLFIYVNGQPHDVGQPIAIGADALVYPGDHLIIVRPDPGGGASP